jgi:hypothetical protein
MAIERRSSRGHWAVVCLWTLCLLIIKTLRRRYGAGETLSRLGRRYSEHLRRKTRWNVELVALVSSSKS